MSRSVRQPKSKSELERMELDELNAELDYLRTRESLAGVRKLKKLFQKEIYLVERVRKSKYHI